MKNFKFYSKLVAVLFLISGIAFLQSCDDETTDPVAKTELQTKITEATDLIASTQEGTANGQYVFGSKETLQNVIDLAQTVFDNADATQTMVDNSVVSLTAAISAYEAQKVSPIAPEALIGHWAFDGGSGTSVKDYSDNGFNGEFKTGHTGHGAGTPTWTTDRYGNANKAVSFDLGAFVEVPYNTALNPTQITIALWVNAAENRENNRFLGLHSWNGYKFQLQSSDKPFFTAATVDGIYDKDSEPSLTLDTWYHVAVTFGGGEMVFYVNGVKTATHTELPGAMAAVVDHNLTFGVSSSKFADTADNYDVDKIIPVAWSGFFHGSLDEVRMYNTVLSSTQIESIYNVEKP